MMAGLNILIVDDSSTMRKMIAHTIRMGQIPIAEVMEASDGAQALEILQTCSLDLVFLDINMPVMNGFELLQIMRADPELAGIPAIVVSTEHRDSRLAEIRELGARFVRKPFTPEQVVGVIREFGETTHASV